MCVHAYSAWQCLDTLHANPVVAHVDVDGSFT
jgi:hypothetical protein